MSENLKVAITTDQASAEFILTFDPTFPSDQAMRLCLERDKSCEPEVTHLMTRVVKPGDLVIDGGANVGFFTCLMSRLVGPTGKVIAIEPTPTNIRKLEHNLANNRMSNVTVVRAALSDQVGEATLHLCPDTGSNSLTQSEYSVGNTKVKTVTLDSLHVEQDPKLIKLDIEGSELRASMGGHTLLQRTQFITCEMNEKALLRARTTSDALREYMGGIGMETFLLAQDGSLPHLVPPRTALRSTKENQMVLFSTISDVGRFWPEVKL